MRLLLIEPSPYGGLLHYIAQLGQALSDRGHSVDLLTAEDNELTGAGLRLTMRDELPRLPVDGPAPTGVRYRVRQARVATTLAQDWAKIIYTSRMGGHDAVITGADMGMIPTAIAGRALISMPGRPPMVRIVHNTRTPNRWGGDNHEYEPRLLREMRNRADHLWDLSIFPGEKARDEYLRGRDIPSVLFCHGPEGIFGDESPPPSDEERILFFGEWRKIKGIEVLMRAFDRIAADRPQARLTIAGPPHPNDLDPEPIRAWAATHDGRVELIDHYVPIEDVAGIFARARVVATPYEMGAQSGVIATAQTMGRAVVTSDVGELGTMVVDGRSGRVVPPGDKAALASALLEIITDRELAERFGREGASQNEDVRGWDKSAELLETALEPIVAAHRRR